MPSTIEMNGVFLPIVTSFDQSGTLDMNNVNKNIQSSNKYDFKGIVVATKTGEMPYLTNEDRVKLVQAAKQNLKAGRFLVAGAGRHGAHETIQLCNQLAQAGAQAALVHAPRAYFERQKPEGWLQHFRQVADQSKIPVIIYNIPQYTGSDLDAQTIKTLAAHQNIIGICDSSENANKIRDVVTATKSQNFHVWAGAAHIMCEYAQAGAVGAMPCLANVMPTEVLQIWANAQGGKQAEAQQVQQRLNTFSQSVKRTYGPGALKHVMDKLPGGQWYGGPVRAPNMPLTQEERQAVEQEFRQASSN